MKTLDWKVRRTGGCKFEAIFAGKGIPFFGAEGWPTISEHFLGKFGEIIHDV